MRRASDEIEAGALLTAAMSGRKVARMNEHDPLDTPSVVADRLGLPQKTLAQWRYLGRGPRWVKIGRHVRYRRSDVDGWLAANTHG